MPLTAKKASSINQVVGVNKFERLRLIAAAEERKEYRINGAHENLATNVAAIIIDTKDQ